MSAVQAAKINETAAAKKWRKRSIELAKKKMAGVSINGGENIETVEKREMRKAAKMAAIAAAGNGENQQRRRQECESGVIGGGINNNEQRRKWKQ
jgi:hypothetical protein